MKLKTVSVNYTLIDWLYAVLFMLFFEGVIYASSPTDFTFNGIRMLAFLNQSFVVLISFKSLLSRK